MAENKLTLHETMEIHEMLNFKTVCMTKSKMMQGLVFDQELKALMEKDVQHSLLAINELQNLLTQTPTQ
ncbi:MAG: spore coat protein [Candidatus Saccharibacteria bacterium]